MWSFVSSCFLSNHFSASFAWLFRYTFFQTLSTRWLQSKVTSSELQGQGMKKNTLVITSQKAQGYLIYNTSSGLGVAHPWAYHFPWMKEARGRGLQYFKLGPVWVIPLLLKLEVNLIPLEPNQMDCYYGSLCSPMEKNQHAIIWSL